MHGIVEIYVYCCGRGGGGRYYPVLITPSPSLYATFFLLLITKGYLLFTPFAFRSVHCDISKYIVCLLLMT